MRYTAGCCHVDNTLDFVVLEIVGACCFCCTCQTKRMRQHCTMFIIVLPFYTHAQLHVSDNTSSTLALSFSLTPPLPLACELTFVMLCCCARRADRISHLRDFFAGATPEVLFQALDRSGWDVSAACEAFYVKCDDDDAKQNLGAEGARLPRISTFCSVILF